MTSRAAKWIRGLLSALCWASNSVDNRANHLFDDRLDVFVIKPAPLQRRDQPPTRDLRLEPAEPLRLLLRKLARYPQRVSLCVDAVQRAIGDVVFDTGLDEVELRAPPAVLFEARCRRRLHLRERFVVEITNARQLLDDRCDLVIAESFAKLSTQFSGGVGALLQQSQRRVETF